MSATTDRTELARKLRGIGISRVYAWQIAKGKRAPSLTLAQRIETELKIPPKTWPLPEVAA